MHQKVNKQSKKKIQEKNTRIYELLTSHLHKMANKYAGWVFEKWEWISEIWLHGEVQEIKDQERGELSPDLELIDQKDTFEYYVKGLSQNKKKVIYGIFWENKTQSEVAKELGMSASNISHLLTSAIMQMRERRMR